MKIKRTKSLVASIMSVVASLVSIGFGAIVSYVILLAYAISTSGTDTSDSFIFSVMLIVMVITVFCSIIGFVLSCISFSYVTGEHEKYAKRKPLLIVTIVFVCLTAILNCISNILWIVNVSFSLVVFVLFTIISVIQLTVAVFYIIDLATEKNKLTSEHIDNNN